MFWLAGFGDPKTFQRWQKFRNGEATVEMQSVVSPSRDALSDFGSRESEVIIVSIGEALPAERESASFADGI